MESNWRTYWHFPWIWIVTGILKILLTLNVFKDLRPVNFHFITFILETQFCIQQ